MVSTRRDCFNRARRKLRSCLPQKTKGQRYCTVTKIATCPSVVPFPVPVVDDQPLRTNAAKQNDLSLVAQITPSRTLSSRLGLFSRRSRPSSPSGRTGSSIQQWTPLGTSPPATSQLLSKVLFAYASIFSLTPSCFYSPWTMDTMNIKELLHSYGELSVLKDRH